MLQPKYRVKFSLFRFLVLYLGFKMIFDVRKKVDIGLWEPFNILHHAGNFESFILAYTIALILFVIILRKVYFEKEKILVYLTIVGLVVGLIVNIVNETDRGQALTGFKNTKDFWDVVWGVVACIISTRFGFKLNENR
jgi:hypothetical protein